MGNESVSEPGSEPWRRAEAAFHIEVWRSFAPYVIGVLIGLPALAALVEESFEN